jgi:hypothetical protein
MTVKLAILKSGENIIADMQEMLLDERVIGYFFDKPCIVKLNRSESEDNSYAINLYPWIPLSKSDRIPVINDWVISIVDPIDTLNELYIKDILGDNKTKKNTEE